MDLPNSQNDLDARFGFLLQPIKDLAKNFDIDLVSSLGDYLTEIAQVTVRFNDGVTTLNFAEAALIIQGSTSVYSQKVEYLYRLTFTVLDLLGNKRQQQQQQQHSSNTVEQSQSSEDEHFLSLDDIDEANNTLMTNDNQDEPNIRAIAPVTPSVLLRPDDTDRTDRQLISRHGEVLGRMSDFRMNTSSLHPNGTLLFDHSHLPYVSAVRSASAQPNHELTSLHAKTLPQQEDPGVDEGFPPDFGNDSDDIEPMDQQPIMDPIQPPNDIAAERPDTRRAFLRKKGVQEPNSEEVQDIWSLLDPHQVSSKSSEKPFRKGKVFKIPDRVSSAPNRKRKRLSQPDATPSMIPFCQLWNSNYFSRDVKISSNLVKVFPDFEGLLWKMAEKQKQLRAQRRAHRNVMQEGREEEINPLLIQDGNGDVGAFGNAVDDDDDDNVEPIVANFEIPDIALEEMLRNDERQNNDLEIHFSESATGLSYEELVQRYVEGFMESARQYVQDTALSQRVVEWEKRIVPRLHEEERRRPFDIHDYGTEVIEKIDSLGGSVHPVPFARVAEGKQQYEVCRYLLATLQLANFGNVELGCPADNGLEMDNATCKLLTRRRHFEQLTEYRVPSLRQNDANF